MLKETVVNWLWTCSATVDILFGIDLYIGHLSPGNQVEILS